MRNPRYANPERKGILLEYDDPGQPFLYVDSGPLYEQALTGAFGVIMEFQGPLIDPFIPPSPEEILNSMQDAIQSHMDSKARERNYDGILSLCTYATSTVPKFQAEGQAGVEWRDACWAKGYAIMAEVQAGSREIPTVEELLAELPVFHWPDEVTP